MNQRSLLAPARRQRGDGKLGCVFWLAALAFFGYFAWQITPAKMDAMELENFIERRAETGGLSQSTSVAKIKKEILTRAEQLEIPLDPDDLEVTKSPARVRIRCAYSVPIDLLVTEWDWQVEIKVERKSLR